MATANRTTERSVEYAACSLGVDYFIHNYIRIDEPQADSITVLPFHLWPAQKKLLYRFLQHRQHIILKARQLGISWLVCAYALWLCMFQAGRNVMLFSKGQFEADELLRRITVMYERLPEWMRATNPLVKQNTGELRFKNGSAVVSLPATKNAGRSLTATLVIVDEFAFLQWALELYTAIKPTIDNGGQLILLSTANGQSGLFYDLWQSAVKRENSLLPSFLSWRARPGRTDVWRETIASDSTLSTLVDQEYPSMPDDAFNNTGSKPFLESIILWDACQEDLPPLRRNEPMILAADAGVTSDTFSLVGVTAHPTQRDKLAVRYVMQWVPSGGKKLDFDPIEATIVQVCRQFAVTALCYDPYQLHQMATRLLNNGTVLTKDFNQGPRREQADKGLLDLILSRRLVHDGNPILRQAAQNADRKVSGDSLEGRKLRIVKRSQSLKVDPLVCLSMACDEALKMGLNQ